MSVGTPRANYLPDEREAIERAIATKDASGLGDLIFGSDLRLYPMGSFDPELVELLCELLSRHDFQSIPKAWSVFTAAEAAFHELTPAQMDRLTPFAAHAFEHAGDGMMAFTMSEWLGEYFHTLAAFDALVRLAASASPDALYAVPHGIEHVVRDAEDQDLRAKAFEFLLSLQSHPAVDVRRETEVSLERLKLRGISSSTPKSMPEGPGAVGT